MLIVIVGKAGERGVARRKRGKGFEELPADTITAEEIATLAGTPTLTGEKQAFLLVGALAGERGEELLDIAEGLAESVHTFVFEEEKILKASLTKLEKSGAVIDVLKTAKTEEAFNVFALAGAMSARNRKKLWLLLIEAFRKGIAPENIVGVLAWKARSACAAARGPERERLERLSRELVVMYHESHRGGGDLGLLLERFALTL